MPINDYMVRDAIREELGTINQTNRLVARAYRLNSELMEGQAEKLDFLGSVPALRRWLGTRVAKKLLEHSHRLVLEKFETSIDMPKNWQKTDKTESVNKAVGEMTRRVPQHHAKKIAELINNAETWLSFDGKAFFANDHSWGASGTIDNIVEATPVSAAAPTELEFADIVVSCIERLATFKDDQGEILREEIDAILVVVPPQYGPVARQVFHADASKLSDGVTEVLNPVRGYDTKTELVVSQHVSIGNAFDVYRDDMDALPWVIGENPDLADATSKGEGSDYEHDTGHRQHGLEVVAGYTYGRFTDGVRAKLTDA